MEHVLFKNTKIVIKIIERLFYLSVKCYINRCDYLSVIEVSFLTLSRIYTYLIRTFSFIRSTN